MATVYAETMCREGNDGVYAVNIVVFHCRNLRLFEGGNHKAFARSRPGLRLVAIPCSGKVEAHHLLKTLAGGARGALVLACAEKACKFFEGSMRSGKRMEYARSWLQEIGMEPDRLEFVHARPMDLDEVDRIVKEFTARLESFDQIPTVAEISAGR